MSIGQGFSRTACTLRRAVLGSDEVSQATSLALLLEGSDANLD